MRHVRSFWTGMRQTVLTTLVSLVVCIGGCKRGTPTLLDDLRFFPADTLVVARIDLSKPAAQSQWQRIFEAFIGVEAGEQAVNSLLEGCTPGLLVNTTTFTIGSSHLSLTAFDQFLWVLRGGFSSADVTACLERLASKGVAGEGKINIAGRVAFQYASGRWAAVAKDGVLISGSVDSLERALSQPAASSLGESSKFLPVLKSWDGQDLWAAVVVPPSVDQMLVSQRAWSAAAGALSYAVLVGEVSDQGVRVTVEAKVTKPGIEVKSAAKDFGGLFLPPCLAGRPIKGPLAKACFSAEIVDDGVRFSGSLSPDSLTTGAQSFARRLKSEQALLVVGSSTLSLSDEVLVKILEQERFALEIVTGAAVTKSKAAGKDLIVISESVESGLVGDRLRDTPVGILCFEPSLFDDLGLTGPIWDSDYGDLNNQTDLIITTNRHSITGGQAATAKVLAKPSKLVWGRPTIGAMVLAHLPNAPGRAGIFAVEAGQPLADGNAASGRRVGAFLGRDSSVDLTDVGKRLVATSANWASLNEFNDDAYLVVGAHPLAPGDVTIAELLTQVGVRPRAVLADEVSVIESNKRGLTIVTESVDSSSIDASVLKRSSSPLVIMEPALFDDLGMTGPEWMIDYGDQVSATSLHILNTRDPFAAGLSGDIVVTSSPAKFIWGKPISSAAVVAETSVGSGRAAIFYYSRGLQMFKDPAPARRVGFFLGHDTSSQLSEAGIRLLKNTLRLALEPEPSDALLVVGDKSLSRGDSSLLQRLQLLSMKVTVVEDQGLIATQTDAFDVVVVSESSLSTRIGANLRGVKSGVVLMEVASFDETGMTGGIWQEDQGDLEPAGDVNILDTSSPLSAGLKPGIVKVAAPPGKVVWGKPFSSALVAATIPGSTWKAAIFGYERGAGLPSGPARGRRVGWFAGRDLPLGLNEAGWRLFDSAVLWAARR